MQEQRTHQDARLSVAEARSIICLPTGGEFPSTVGRLRSSSHHEGSATLEATGQPPIRELGGTLSSRFAALARKSGSRRNETRGHARTLVGRRANLNDGSGGEGNASGYIAAGSEACLSPLRR